MSGGVSNRPALLLKSKILYTRWNHAATAGGFIAPRAIAPVSCAVSLAASGRSEIRSS